MIPARTSSRLTLGLVLLLVVLRSIVFVCFEQADFDSDQAVYGLMTKHLTEARAFPLFMYGNQYMLAVSVYLSAPFFLLFGPSVASLKVALLGINLVIAALLFIRLRKEPGLSPPLALAATASLVMPPVLTSSRLLEACGGNIEPFWWILLLWMVRSRPVLLGVVGAVGVLNREFVAYGLVAALTLDAQARRRVFISGPVFVGVVLIVHWVARTFSSNYFYTIGPGSPFVWRLDITRLAWLFGQNLPDIFGAHRVLLADFNIGSRLAGGAWLAGLVFVAGLAVAGWRLIRLKAKDTAGAEGFPLYLCLVGFLSVAVYVCFAPVVLDRSTIRYDLLVLLLPCGLFALYFARETNRALMRTVVVCIALWATQNAWSHARLHVEYLTSRPINSYRLLVDYLEGQHLTVGQAPYWTAYHVTFLSGERVIVAPDSVERIPAYRKLYETSRRRFSIREGACGTSGQTVLRWCVAAEDGSEEQRR